MLAEEQLVQYVKYIKVSLCAKERGQLSEMSRMMCQV